MHAALCFFCQFMLVGLIFYQLIIYEFDLFFEEVNSVLQLLARFICATILHLALIDEVYTGMDNMKYSLNHPYLFQSWFQAWIAGFLQAFIVSAVEFCNIAIILTSLSPIGTVFNFIALAIIADFDNFVYESLRNEKMKKLLYEDVKERILIINHTTSKRCTSKELSNVLDENGDRRPLKILFKDRTCGNKCLYMFYKVMRCWYVSYYFYFQPFAVVFLSIFLPLLAARGSNKPSPVVQEEHNSLLEHFGINAWLEF